jgi:hypothetical protein
VTGLVEALRQPGSYPHAVAEVRLVETHISWVFLTGPYAYKVKKPVDFGFLDFSTLAKRRTLCEAELALNRRFAPSLYLDVVPIAATPTGVSVGGAGDVVEWAVRMRQFPDDAQMDARLAASAVRLDDLVGFAEYLADTHARLPIAGSDSPYGSTEAVYAPVRENFEQIAGTPFATRRSGALDALATWSAQAHGRLASHFDARREAGFVRECHGDLHLSNLVLLDGRAIAFDCIEFNPGLRWIDVVSDAAFLVMDLETRECGDLAYGFLDRYLERTGDYAGARALGFYLVYRSLVRAKVAALQARGGSGDTVRLAARFDLHVDYALRRSARAPRLVITCGVSGSGKSWLAERLVPRLPAVRIRSDVERKRLHGLGAAARTGSGIASGLYGRAASESTYERLRAAADALLEAGTDALIDATFLDAAQRAAFAALAHRHGAAFRILYCTAPESVLRARVEARARTATDPSEADERVLAAQLAGASAPPTGPEVVAVDTSAPVDWDGVVRALAR